MKKLVEEILTEMDQPRYVPSEADALVLIAHYLKSISESLAPKTF